MLTIALWAFLIAYGRMTRPIGVTPFLILSALAIGLTYLTSGLYPVDFYLQIVMNFAFFVVFFLIGHGVGRFLDRDKDL